MFCFCFSFFSCCFSFYSLFFIMRFLFESMLGCIFDLIIFFFFFHFWLTFLFFPLSLYFVILLEFLRKLYSIYFGFYYACYYLPFYSKTFFPSFLLFFNLFTSSREKKKSFGKKIKQIKLYPIPILLPFEIPSSPLSSIFLISFSVSLDSLHVNHRERGGKITLIPALRSPPTGPLADHPRTSSLRPPP